MDPVKKNPQLLANRHLGFRQLTVDGVFSSREKKYPFKKGPPVTTFFLETFFLGVSLTCRIFHKNPDWFMKGSFYWLVTVPVEVWNVYE